MRNRKQISNKVKKNLEKIKALEEQNIELLIESYLLSDKIQKYTEQEENILICGRPKKFETKTIGRIHWEEHFVDEETGNVISIERTQVVRVNGEWLCRKTTSFKTANLIDETESLIPAKNK